MEYLWVIIVGLVILFVLIIAGIYNALVRKKNYVKEAWASIDVQLKRKGNVLPNLIDTLKMQTDYESGLLTKITQARSGLISGSNEDRMKANDEITKMLPSIYAVAENYPTLGANESFRKLMDEIRDVEDKIAYARNRYNISVNDFNTAIKIFPNVLFAEMFGFSMEPFFEITEDLRKDYDNMRIKDIK